MDLQPLPAPDPVIDPTAEVWTQSVTQPPRIWTVFLSVTIAFLTMLALAVAATIPFIVMTFLNSQGTTPSQDDLIGSVTTPIAIFAQGFAGQLGILVVAIGAAWFSPIEFRRRLGLTDSGLTTQEWLCVGVGSFAPAALGLVLATLLAQILAPDETAAKLFENMPLAMVVPWVLFISLFPGFGEEMLFRGLMQRRLLERWRPWTAITVTSLIFALFHLMPHTVVFAFPIGMWFGYIAWKTGSIWPTILAHVLINGTWNILNISKSHLGYSDQLYVAICSLLVVIGIPAFSYSLPAIRRVRTDFNSDPPKL
ncbi:MAG: CPBP family intramembrane glutamic endopeptidase [Pirellula sp.]